MIPADPASARDFPDPRQLIADTDWGRLEVMVGPEQGCPAVPDLLATLLEGVPAARARALFDLGAAVHYSNTIVEATAPALLVVAALLTDPGTDRVALPSLPYRSSTPSSVRAGLLRLVEGVTGDVDQATEVAGRRHGFPMTAEMLQVRAIRPVLFPVVHGLLDDLDADVRVAAALAVVPLLEDSTLAPHRAACRERARTILSASPDPRDRALAALPTLTPPLLRNNLFPPVDGGFDDDPPF
ncbi:hypothetical protein [Actinomadura sp. 21ATH]|uniref:hypothetical protein n=1 Tax=Actinomadura sp. 21ATH TaxID=1735444 RepID=UPI0035BFB586